MCRVSNYIWFKNALIYLKTSLKKLFFNVWKLKVCCCSSAKDLISGL